MCDPVRVRKLFDTAFKIHLGEFHYKLSGISNFMMYKVNNTNWPEVDFLIHNMKFLTKLHKRDEYEYKGKHRTPLAILCLDSKYAAFTALLLCCPMPLLDHRNLSLV